MVDLIDEASEPDDRPLESYGSASGHSEEEAWSADHKMVDGQTPNRRSWTQDRSRQQVGPQSRRQNSATDNHKPRDADNQMSGEADFVNMEDLDRGHWLKTAARQLDHLQAQWLLGLCYFDARNAYALDGQVSTVDWMIYHLHMAPRTAYEKLELAKALPQHPLLVEAMVEGRVSYSAAREIARMVEPDPEVERAVIDLASSGSVIDVQQAVRSYQLHREQDLPPSERENKRKVNVSRTADGMTRITITATHIEAERSW